MIQPSPSGHTDERRAPHHPARRARRGRQEHDPVRVRRAAHPHRRRPCVPTGRAPRRRPRPAGLLLPRGPAAALDRPHPRPRGSRRRAAVRAPRGRGGRCDRHQADARAWSSRSSTSTASARPRPCARPTRTATGCRSARSSSSSSAWRIRSRTASRSSSRRRPDACLHTGDWKLDHTPVDGLKTDVGKLASLGNRGIDLMLGDSTNAERPGMTGSERLVGEAFRQLIPVRTGRILVASFASNIHRMQQAAEVAIANNRKVALVGRSLRKNMNIARNLGLHQPPRGRSRLAEGGDGAAARTGSCCSAPAARASRCRR